MPYQWGSASPDMPFPRPLSPVVLQWGQCNGFLPLLPPPPPPLTSSTAMGRTTGTRIRTSSAPSMGHKEPVSCRLSEGRNGYRSQAGVCCEPPRQGKEEKLYSTTPLQQHPCCAPSPAGPPLSSSPASPVPLPARPHPPPPLAPLLSHHRLPLTWSRYQARLCARESPRADRTPEVHAAFQGPLKP